MTDIERDIEKLLAGEIVDTGSIDLSFRTQSSAAPNEEYVPVVKRTVCYIVMALVFDDEGRVVLIQEAKASCRGLWYIPAGRVEPGENFIDAAKREVLEEAGLEFEPLTLLSVTSQLQRKWLRLNFVGRMKGTASVGGKMVFIVCCGKDALHREVLEEAGLRIEPLTLLSVEMYGKVDFYRMVYIGRVAGGKLKTLEEQDSESLQAKWFTVDEILNGDVQLRHTDFFKSLSVARKYISQPETSRHPHYQIGIQPHQHLLLRPVLIKQTEGCIEVLCCKKGGKTRLPCCKLHPREFSLATALLSVFRDVFQYTKPWITLLVKGLLTVEHCGIPAREHDGICLTPVFVLPGDLHDKLKSVPNKDYIWYKISDTSISEELTRRTFTENLLIPLLEK